MKKIITEKKKNSMFRILLFFIFTVQSVAACIDKPVTEGMSLTGTDSGPSVCAPTHSKSNVPKVLVIGDSISLGYTPYLTKMLKGQAAVIHHKGNKLVGPNAGPTIRGVEYIDQWLGSAKWDVIHFNFGLWDMYGWHYEKYDRSPEAYEKRLDKLVTRLKKTGAKLIWATTTPVCPGPERLCKVVVSKKTERKYLDAALRVMKTHGVAVNDLYGFIQPQRAKYALADNDVHFTKEGYRALAGQTAKYIKAALPAAAAKQATNQIHEADIVIYGGTSAAVISAVQAQQMGKSVIVVSPDRHLGGLSSGGLGFTDTGNKSVIGGLSRRFYQRIWKHYNNPNAWKWQKKSEYGNRGQGTQAIDGKDRTMWIFEPHVAEQVFEDFVAEYKITVYRDEWLDRGNGVKLDGKRIVSITTLSGKRFKGKVFIDASYEGDLMAAAGVSYHVGREANSVYGETFNGIQIGVLHHGHNFGKKKVSPYVKPGDPTSGILPGVSAETPGKKGDGDHRVQAYCFRMCLTDHPDNMVPFAKPQGYNPEQYEILARVLNAGWRGVFRKFDPIPNRKTDTNNHGPFSTDNIGMNYDYPEASYQRRREIIKQHETYQKGLMYFLANDPKVPADISSRMRKWGLAKDEFTDNGNWPHQLYIREARRMVGEYVTTENDVQGKRKPPKPVGMGSYTMDSHNVQRYIKPDGFVQNEGDIGIRPKKPYHIAYGSIVPKKNECVNLIVPVCVSSSHIAFGSIRMEPVFMILGQSAATAASLAIDEDLAVQDVSYDKLKRQLLADNQRL